MKLISLYFHELFLHIRIVYCTICAIEQNDVFSRVTSESFPVSNFVQSLKSSGSNQ